MNEINIKDLLETSNPVEGNCQGIYFLFYNKELVYIGKGWNCLLRVAEHTRKESEKTFTSWNFIPVDTKDELGKFEKQLIMQQKPKYNKIYT
jgi:excinuclease UvrABC nuclease subunit